MEASYITFSFNGLFDAHYSFLQLLPAALGTSKTDNKSHAYHLFTLQHHHFDSSTLVNTKRCKTVHGVLAFPSTVLTRVLLRVEVTIVTNH